MGKIPHFAGRSSLSLTDLQALADAVPLPVAQVQPAAATRGRVQYGLAQYHVPVDECAGEVAVPDAEGMIAGVKSWLPGWEYLTDEQRKAGIEAVLMEAAEQLIREQEARMTPEELANLKTFCAGLHGPTQVFEYGSPEEAKEPLHIAATVLPGQRPMVAGRAD